MATTKNATRTAATATKAVASANRPASRKATAPKPTATAPKPTATAPKPTATAPKALSPEVREPRALVSVTRSGPNGIGTTVVTRPNSLRIKGHAWRVDAKDGVRVSRCECTVTEGTITSTVEGRDLHQKHLRAIKASKEVPADAS
jgi:hypothetical protein